MPPYFLDTSVLLKLYVQEQGSDILIGLAAGADARDLAISSLAEVELRSALRRREREGSLTAERIDEILAAFSQDLRDRFVRVPPSEHTINDALQIIDRRRLRAYDAMQLASCMSLREETKEHVTFVCADDELLAAARVEGFTTLNPLTDR